MNPTQAQQSLKDAQTTTPMKIPSIGNYLTQDGQTAIVDDIAGDTCLGRISRGGDPVVWDRVTGKAFLANGTSAPHLSIVSPAPPQWYRLLAAGDTFQDEGGIVYTVVSVDESGRADIEWFSPSSNMLLRSREHLSDRWIATRSTPISVAAMKALQVAQVAPWRERIIQLIETAHRDPTGSGRLICGDVAFHMDCSRVTVFREAPNNSRHTVYLKSPEIIGAFKARMTQLAVEAARAHDDARSAAIEALLQ